MLMTLLLTLIVQVGPAHAQALAGRWVTTAVPEPGAAPTLPPEMTITIEGGVGHITSGTGSKATAVLFVPRAGTASLPMLRYRVSAAATAPSVIVRLLDRDRVSVEWLFEPRQAGAPGETYAEVFVRAK